jgi:TonB-dependent receptor
VVDEDHNLVDFYLAPYANTPTAGLSANQGSAGAFRTTHRSFGFLQRSQYLQAGFNWKSDSLNIDGIIATQRAENVDDTNFLNYLSNIPNIRIQVNPENGVPTFTAGPGYDFNDPVSLATPARGANGAIVQTVGIQSQYQPKEGDLGEDTAKLDVDWFVDGFINKVEFGYQGRKSTSLRYQPNGYTTFDPADPTRAPIYVQGAFINYNLNMVPGLTTTGQPVYSYDVAPITTGAVTVNQAFTQADILAFMQQVNQLSPGEFWKGGPDQGVTLPTNWFAPDVTQLESAGLIDTSQWNHDCVRRCVGRNAAGQIVGEFDQTPGVDTEENINAVYGQVSFAGDFFGMTLKGNTGVRVIKSEVIATGAISEQLRPASGPLTQGRTRIYTINKSYTDALPTFNLSLDITDKLVARFGYAKLLARPKINDLLPNGSCIFNDLSTGSDFPVDDSCSLGNPALNPYRANSYDLSVGYYWNPDTLVNVAVFQKDLVTFTLGRQLVTGVDVFNDGNLIDVTMPVNGSGATQQGVELTAQTAFTWLPAPFDGFGVQANYTYATAKNVGLFDTLTGEELTQAGLSKNTYNLILYYDKGPINARLAYNARTPYFTGGGTAGRAGRNAGTEYLDGKFTYEINEHLSTFVEAQNLTGEIETSYGGSIRINNRSYSGKRFFVGATYKY